ncbi:MAG: hypothetical protein ACKO7P_15770 [Bacteroidota bacterium]
MKRKKKILTFYSDQQVCFDLIERASFSKSPLKPYLLMKRIKEKGFSKLFKFNSDFKPFSESDFKIAHTETYVHNVFKGEGNYLSNSLPWSKNLAHSLTYTNSALHEAIKFSILIPENLCFAPISGMHHAKPDRGSGFCTFSGQVISAIKIYEEYKLSGAYFDLDGHFGNSIEDTREFNPILNLAIPKGCNVNPTGKNENYLKSFENSLERIGKLIKTGKIHYVVFAHGADSHEDDDIGGGCDTKHWLLCATRFSEWVNEISREIGRPLPVTLALFGGYRSDNYNAVLDLHLKSILTCSRIIGNNEITDDLVIPRKSNKRAII